MTREERIRDERRRLTVKICARIAGGQSLRQVLGKERERGFPNSVAFWHWRANDPEIHAVYERAIRDRVLREAEELVELADSEPKRDAEGRVDPGWVAWLRVRIDVRKWNAARMQPKLYGDRTIVSGDADSPLHVELADPKAALLGRLAAQPAANGDRGESSGTDG